MSRITRSLSANTIFNTSLSTFPGRLLLDKTLSPLCYQIKASVFNESPEGWELKATCVETELPRGH